MKVLLEERGIVTNVFVPSKAVYDDFRELTYKFKELGHKMIPNNDVIKTSMFKENKKWIEKAVQQGHIVIDIGNASDIFSPFYAMEKSVVRKAFEVEVKNGL